MQSSYNLIVVASVLAACGTSEANGIATLYMCLRGQKRNLEHSQGYSRQYTRTWKHTLRVRVLVQVTAHVTTFSKR